MFRPTTVLLYKPCRVYGLLTIQFTCKNQFEVKTKIPKVERKNTWSPEPLGVVSFSMFSLLTTRSFILHLLPPCKGNAMQAYLLLFFCLILAGRNECLWLRSCISFCLSQAFTHQSPCMNYSYKRKKMHSYLNIFSPLMHIYLFYFSPQLAGFKWPLFSLSIALLLPAYVGLISFPSSSMMASSSAYLFWGTWLPVDPWSYSKMKWNNTNKIRQN